MNRRTTSRLLVSGMFLVSMMFGAPVTAQTVAHPSSSQQGQSSKAAQNRAAVQNNPACQRIVAECKNLGFIVGEWRKDNGLWKDCFDPVVKGGTPTREGKPIHVPVSPTDIQACRAATQSHPK